MKVRSGWLYAGGQLPQHHGGRQHPAVEAQGRGESERERATARSVLAGSERVVWSWLCVCTRDVKEEHPLVLVLSAFLRANDEFDQRERSEFPQ